MSIPTERGCALSRLALCALFASLVLSAPSADAALVYALTDENDLLTFDSESPEDLIDAGAILGLDGEDLVGIDIRPATNQLYGLGSFGFMYRINPVTKATERFGFPVPINGSRFGFDFSPVADRLRIVSDTDINLRVNVDTNNSTIVDSPLQYGPGQPGASGDNPNVVGIAYTNSTTVTPTSTTLYGIDVRTNEDRLVIQDPPNSGVLTVVGPLGVNASALMGFDILSVGSSNTGFAAMQLTSDGVSQFYRIDLNTGAATLIGDIGGGDLIDGIAVVVPEPATLGMALFAVVGGLAARRQGP